MSIWKALRSTFMWLLVNAFFGLTQYFILIYGSWLGLSHFGLKETIAEGILMFFGTALMGSISYDYIVADIAFPKEVNYLISALPLIVLMSVCVMYSQIHFNHLRILNTNNLGIFHKAIIIISILYCYTIKTIIFMKEKL